MKVAAGACEEVGARLRPRREGRRARGGGQRVGFHESRCRRSKVLGAVRVKVF